MEGMSWPGDGSELYLQVGDVHVPGGGNHVDHAGLKQLVLGNGLYR